MVEAGVERPAGTPDRVLLLGFRTVNLLAETPETWSAPEARAAARAIQRPPISVLLGRRVAAAFGFDGDFFEAREDERGLLILLPHCSGLSRMYNDADVRRRVGLTLGRIAGWAT